MRKWYVIQTRPETIIVLIFDQVAQTDAEIIDAFKLLYGCRMEESYILLREVEVKK